MMLIALQVMAAMPLSANAQSAGSTAPATTTPIKHVIVIIGENRTFDHVFATYKPKEGETVNNLLSEGIVKANGKPGPNYSLSAQFSALDNTTSGTGSYSNSPQSKSIYGTLPPALAGGPIKPTVAGPAPFTTLKVARLADTGLASGYEPYLLTGATGITGGKLDTRITGAATLKEGVYQLSGSNMPYDAYTASPVHRFFQMWQQTDCNADYATKENASGCLNDLFPWVETSVGTGSNGAAQTKGFTNTSTGEGSAAMGFYNMAQGDAPYFRELADKYTISDNFHQSVMGGTGANHIMFGFADAIWYSNGAGQALVPPSNQIENPDPQPTTNNYYDQDGYGGGSYVDCQDIGQPGVPAVTNYLQSLKRPVSPNCDKGHYYLVNNYNPGYNGDGTLASAYSPFTIPPTSVKSIGDSLIAKNVPFKYFGENWDLYVTDPTESNSFDEYCNICNPFQYETSIMGTQATREQYIADTTQLYEDIDTGNLPPVSIVKPSGFNDGHPASSKLDLYEGFVKKIVNQVKANPTLWADTAIFVTFDEGGGYYDSGYIQPVDFFGDGTRIPLIIVSKYTEGGHVSHEYGDHVSLIKFIEKNWGLSPITTRSRDNLPNPTQKANNPYVPTNSPAIGDLVDNFSFSTK
ncbi:alkaline phosphatase family protein [Granulicella tundricola]|uniref:Phosphoesterase n=1 Tax=Granulicella tundricola (strain ATCC BAA-1859 / DSM 23138 / MP5ACTX9) TaxID=1198114 RepID=E8WY27_GRATM|nr:alkaline phosphatase family protein [Granulicella tundricola]ADW67566.1 phosphoesterase [Granulicella tundricola MP5ACTX9]